VKVATERLDSLINMVGELVIAQSMVCSDVMPLAGGNHRVQKNMQHLGKITRELSRKYPTLRVWMLIMEEFQNYFETDDQDVNKEIAALLSFIMAVGPSAGVIIL